MQLDIVSDTVCPWCYIGKKRLEATLSKWDGEPVSVVWHPFQLDASIPAEGIDQKEYMAMRFGGDASHERLKGARQAIVEAGHELGVDFRFDLIRRRPNTRDSHRLIRWAGTANCQDSIVESLFRRFFTQGEDIGQHEVLLDAAAECGMDVDIVRGLLASDADKALIEEEEIRARRMGIQSVPSFIVNGKWMLVGAQDEAVMRRALDQVASQSGAAAS